MTQLRLDHQRSDGQPISTTLSTSGIVGEGDQQHAIDAVDAALSDVDLPIRRCVLRLENHVDSHHVHLATARCSVDLDGVRVHAHADGESLAVAVDRCAAKLHDQLRRHIDRRQDARRHGRSIRDLDDGDAAGSSARVLERPTDERELVTRQPFGPSEATLDEAAFDLDALGYDFHLFVETVTGDDVLIRRDGADGVVVRFATGAPESTPDFEQPVPLAVDERPVPQLDVRNAREQLAVGGFDHVFFRDAETGHGAVVYRRYDGHDGLITNPRSETSGP